MTVQAVLAICTGVQARSGLLFDGVADRVLPVMRSLGTRVSLVGGVLRAVGVYAASSGGDGRGFLKRMTVVREELCRKHGREQPRKGAGGCCQIVAARVQGEDVGARAGTSLCFLP